VGLEVEDFNQTIAELKKRHVTFHQEVMETGVCHLAVVNDPDGNPLFIHKRKPGHG
jgi:predicted enzyme related to lactoylglutathione lyase